METASFIGFIETICYILFFYYVFKFVVRLLLPVIVKKLFEKVGQNFQPNTQSQKNTTNPENGNVPKKPIAKPRETNKVGEYVDFEEID